MKMPHADCTAGWIAAWSMLLCCAWANVEKPQVIVLPEPEPLRVFAGVDRTIRVVLHNPTAQTIRIDVRTQLYQLNSATAVRLSETLWKQLQMLPGQTVVETASLSFPPVNVPTRMVVRWMDPSNRSLGTTEVWVHPPDLLKGLNSLADLQPLGVFDPGGDLKPLLRRAAVDFQDIEHSGFGAFEGKLAIVGPLKPKAWPSENLAAEIVSLAKRGAAVVWIQPPTERRERLQPSFSNVPLGKGTVLVVQPGLVSKLADDPQSQLNLMELARQALHPAPAQLPNLTESLQTEGKP